MTAWYGAPQPLAASRGRRRTKRLALWRHRKVSNVPRRNRAAARSTRRKGTERHVAVARESGATSQRPLRCGARETARARRSSGVQRATGRGARSRASTSEQSGVVPRQGAAYDGLRAEWLAGQVSSGHAAAAACDGKGIRVDGPCRNSLRGRDCLRAEPDRPAKLIRTPARAADAAPGAADLPCPMRPPTRRPAAPMALHGPVAQVISTRSLTWRRGLVC